MQQRSARTAHRPGERKRAEHRDRRPDTPRSDVQPQGQRQGLPPEPLDDDLVGRNADHFDADAEYRKAERRVQHLRFERKYLPRADAQRRHRPSEIGRNGPILEQRARDHQPDRKHSREAGAFLVEDHPAENKHQQENVEPAVTAGKNAVVGTVPAELLLEHRLERSHRVGHDIARQHRERYQPQHRPAGGGRVGDLLA